jgi:hypothetical protein
MLASEYGWAKNDILDTVYPNELFILSRLITRRRINANRTALAIATNPHTKDGRKLWQEFDRQERSNEGKEYLDAEFDQAGFDAFKNALQRSNSSIVVK